MSRVGWLDLAAGISGDMFLGALADAEPDVWPVMREAVTRLGEGRLDLAREDVLRGGLRGTHVRVLLDGKPVREAGGPDAQPGTPVPHVHGTDVSSLRGRLDQAPLDPQVRQTAAEVFDRLAAAEADRHGVEGAHVHFHEVGTWDALADVVGTVAGVRALKLDALYHGIVNVGGGVVQTAHGELPVPAPATLELLRGRACRVAAGGGERTTPTGAALLLVLAQAVAPPAAFVPEQVGYGAGSADPPGIPNLTRLTLGRTGDAAALSEVAVVEASLDDATPEEGGFLLQSLLEAGAWDATLTPLIMKKGRPGFLVRAIVPPAEGEAFARLMVERSPSLGARWRLEPRLELPRRFDTVALPEGEVRVKVAQLPDGTERPHAEFEDLARVARERGCGLSSVRLEVEARWRESR